jgi:hypothetical protein
MLALAMIVLSNLYLEDQYMKRWLLMVIVGLIFVSCGTRSTVTLGQNDNGTSNIDAGNIDLNRIEQLESEVVALKEEVAALKEESIALSAMLRSNSSNISVTSELTSANAESTIRTAWDLNGLWDSAGDFDGLKPAVISQFIGVEMKSDYEAEASFFLVWDCGVVTTYNSNLKCYSPNEFSMYGSTSIAFFNKTPEGWKLKRIAYRLWDMGYHGVEYDMPIMQ